MTQTSSQEMKSSHLTISPGKLFYGEINKQASLKRVRIAHSSLLKDVLSQASINIPVYHPESARCCEWSE